MRAILVSVCLVACSTALAQENVFPGALVDDEGKVWVGNFQIFSRLNVVVWLDAGRREVFPAWRAHELRYYDSAANLNHRLITLRGYNGEDRYYELIVEGAIRVVRHHPGTLGTPREVDYHYFFIEENVLYPLRDFRSRLYRKIIPAHDHTAWDPNVPADAIRYIQLYNRSVRLTLVSAVN